MIRGGKVIFGLLLTTALAGPALAAQARDPATPVSAPVALEFDDFYAIPDPQALALRSALSTAVADGILLKADLKAIAAFYAERGFEPVWIVDGAFTPEALALIDRIRLADADGLDASDYTLPWTEVGLYLDDREAKFARADLQLSQAVALYARHAYSGRVTPSEVSSNFGYKLNPPAAGDVLGLVSGSPDPVATLEAYNPSQPEFLALRAELARLRAGTEAEDSVPVVADGALLKPGMSDPRVPVIRERLQLASATVDPELYDEILVAGVKGFQATAGLRTDGIVGKNTVAAMNGGSSAAGDPVETVLLNMERWRWMPRYLGDFYVRVNIPNYNLDVYRDGEVFHTTRIVVGKVGSQTPIFSDEIENVVVNPYWNVPQSIIRNEMMPAIRKGGGLRGYQVYAKVRGKYRAVDPRSVNWRKVDARSIQVRQPPGSRNALGEVKFLFPNKYDVYLHDTPSKSLFEKETRAFSHGCMRVMNPWDFAEALLSSTDQVTAAELKKRVGGGENWTNLESHIPVHITYFTAWIDPSGKLQVRPDIYGHDTRLAAALGNS
jgi:murein L,D-transpeptidase YcbB/YkuD